MIRLQEAARFELVLHGTYHVDNVPASDWKDMPDRSFYACETCGLTVPESFELLKVGRDTLAGDYSNRWIAEAGATAGSPKIDWTTSAHPLWSFSPPYNTSDPAAREAMARHLAPYLPEPLQASVRTDDHPARRYGLDEFVRRVSARTGLTLQESSTGVASVLMTLREALPPDEFADAMSQLPGEFRGMLEPVS